MFVAARNSVEREKTNKNYIIGPGQPLCVCVCVCSHRITSRFVFIIVFFSSFLKFSIMMYQCF